VFLPIGVEPLAGTDGSPAGLMVVVEVIRG
jgi:hypothetical protein